MPSDPADSVLDTLGRSPQLLNQIQRRMKEMIHQNLKAVSISHSPDPASDELLCCSITDCVKDMLNHYQFRDGDRSHIHWEKGPEFRFSGDPIAMFRVLANLINNALQQIEENRGGEIFIFTQCSTAGNVLRIKDTAGGMSPETLERLFEPYHSRKRTGTGIGLPYCRVTMERFGGSIQCRSVSGVGTEFDLIFPILSEISSADHAW